MAQTNVIQGHFPNGLPRFDERRDVAQPKTAPAGWVQQAIARPAAQAPAQPARHAVATHVQRAVAQPQFARARVAQPQPRLQAPAPPPPARPGNAAVSPAAQRTPNGCAVQLPVQLAAGFARTPGRPLPGAVRQKMEAVFERNFDDVRIHVGPQAQSIGAFAFTRGTDVYFAPGRYDPHTAQGQRLLAHELSHVVQQREDRVRNPFGSGIAVMQEAALEAEAERMSLKAATWLPDPASDSDCVQPFAARVIQLGIGKPRAVRNARAKAKSKRTRRSTDDLKTKAKFSVTVDGQGWYVPLGRPQFTSVAKKIKVKAGSQDRRHIIPYHRLRDLISKAASRLKAEKGESAVTARVKELIKLSGSRARTFDVASLIKVANSNPRNLFPEDAAENQGIEKIRSAAKKAWQDLATLYATETTVELSAVKKRAKTHFQFKGSTPITFHMAWISGIVSSQIEEATTAGGVFDAIRAAERSTELDLNKKKGSKVQTAAVLALNNKMQLYLLASPEEVTGADGLDLIETFFKLPAG